MVRECSCDVYCLCSLHSAHAILTVLLQLRNTLQLLGSEGTMGIVTEAVVRVCNPAPVTRYGSIVFPDFDSGVAW